MEKSIAFKIFLFIFIKYVFFYIFLMYKNSNFSLLEWNNIIKGHSLIYFFFVMLIPIILCIIFCFTPLYLAFKANNKMLSIFYIFTAFAFEYFLYVFETSRTYFYDLNGIYNALFSLAFLILFLFSKNTVSADI